MKKCKILSLDIWDTVLRRKCHPDEIKMKTARFLYITYFYKLKENYRNVLTLAKKRVSCERRIGEQHPAQFDDEYRIEDVFLLWCTAVFEKETDFSAVVKDLYEYELNAEKAMCYLDPTILSEIEGIEYEKIGYISDFYADSNFLDTLLEYAGFPIKMDFKYISCEKMQNKRSGKLYDLALKEFGIRPEDQIHLGDNAFSDVTVPTRKGIRAIHYVPEQESALRKERESKFSFQKEAHIEDFLADDLKLSDRGHIGVFFYSFVLWVMENCIENGIDTVYYFTREGEFFIQLHQAIEKSNPYQVQVPASRILEVSRIATFGASLRCVTLDEMMRIWNQYSIQSMRAFFKSVAVDLSEVRPYLQLYGIPEDETITYPWLDERVKKLFSDQEFVHFFEAHIKEQKELFMAYAQSKGMDLCDHRKIAIVDIGWRGTIQDNLCYLFPNYEIYGYYLGLIPFLNPQPKNARKFGFINQYKFHDMILKSVTPLEMLCNSPNGSTTGYRRTENGVIAVRKREAEEDAIFNRYTKRIQEQVLADAEQLNEILKTHALVSENCTGYAYRSLYALICNPSKELADEFFQLKHNEEFGVGGFIDKHTKLRLALMVKAVFSRKCRKELKAFLESTSWPQGYFIKYGLSPVNVLYNKFLVSHFGGK